MIRGGRMRCRAHSSQRYMCASVPQREVAFTRIKTSNSPGLGSGTCCRVNPDAGFVFTNARMYYDTSRPRRAKPRPFRIMQGKIRNAKLKNEELMGRLDSYRETQ